MTSTSTKPASERVGEERGIVEKVTDTTGLSSGRILNIISIIVGLAVWEVAGRSVPRTLFSPPSAVVNTWIDLVMSGRLPVALLGSFQHMFLGYAIAVVTAIPLGFLIGRSDVARWAISPYVDAVYATPTVAYIPLIIVWFGLQFKARVFMVFMMCFFEMLIDTQQGIASINVDYLDVGRSFDVDWWTRQRKILLPASLPYVFTGLRIGVGRAVRGMIVAELFLAVVNLGAILTGSAASFNTALQLAVIATISLVGVVFQSLVKLIERQTIPWHFHDAGAE